MLMHLTDCAASQEVRAGRMLPEEAQTPAQDAAPDARSGLHDQNVLDNEGSLDSPTHALPDDVIQLLDEELLAQRISALAPKEAPRVPGNAHLSSLPALPQQATSPARLTPPDLDLVSPFGPMPPSTASQRTKAAGFGSFLPGQAPIFNPRAVSGLGGEDEHERSRRDAGPPQNLLAGDLSTLRHLGRYPTGSDGFAPGEIPLPERQSGYRSRQPHSSTAGVQVCRGWACGPAGDGGEQRWHASGFDPWRVPDELPQPFSALAMEWSRGPRQIRGAVPPAGTAPSIGTLQAFPAPNALLPGLTHLPVIGEAPDALRMRALPKRTAGDAALMPREAYADELTLRDLSPEAYCGRDFDPLAVLRAEARADDGHKKTAQYEPVRQRVAAQGIPRQDLRDVDIGVAGSGEMAGRPRHAGASTHSAAGLSCGLPRHLAAKAEDLDGESREHWKSVAQILNKQWVESDKFDRILAEKGITVPPLRFGDGARKPGARLGVVANALQRDPARAPVAGAAAPSIGPGPPAGRVPRGDLPPIMRTVGALPSPFRRPAEGANPTTRLDPSQPVPLPVSRWLPPAEEAAVCGTCGKCRMASRPRDHTQAPLPPGLEPDSAWKRVGAVNAGSDRPDPPHDALVSRLRNVTGRNLTGSIPPVTKPAARPAQVVWPSPSWLTPPKQPEAAGKLEAAEKLAQVGLPSPFCGADFFLLGVRAGWKGFLLSRSLCATASLSVILLSLLTGEFAELG